MKHLKTCAITALLALCYFAAPAQQTSFPLNEPDRNKPQVFANLPQRMNLQVADLEALLTKPVGAVVNVTLATGLTLKGLVISKSNPADESVKSVVISNPSRRDARFTFTRLQKKNGEIKYLGRMMSHAAGDALELVKEDNHYVLVKTSYHDLINE